MAMRFLFQSRAGQLFSQNGTAIVSARPAEQPTPFLKTPWVYSGPEGLDISRLFATPLKNGDYVLTQVVMKHHGPLLGLKSETDIDGPCSLVEAMNKMERFMHNREVATGVFSLPTGRVDYERFARKMGLAYDLEEGFIDRKEAEAKAAQRAAAGPSPEPS